MRERSVEIQNRNLCCTNKIFKIFLLYTITLLRNIALENNSIYFKLINSHVQMPYFMIKLNLKLHSLIDILFWTLLNLPKFI